MNKQIWQTIKYYFNLIVFPPAKVALVIWTIYCIISAPSAITQIKIGEYLIVFLFGSVLWIGIADAVYFFKFKDNYLRYKLKMQKPETITTCSGIKHPKTNINIPNTSSLQTTVLDSHSFAFYQDFCKILLLLISQEKCSIGLIQRNLEVNFNEASMIMDMLVKYGVVESRNDTMPHRIILSSEEIKRLFEKIKSEGIPATMYNDTSIYSPSSLYTQACDFDSMEGHEFEHYCADILSKNGFIDVEVTQGSGDHGIDILAEKDDISYAIQCKCYSSNIGNAAVQQAHTGKSLYKKDVAVVLTNRYFTQQAKSEAQQLGVKLWDRDKLQQLIDST